jgi:16S rRNA (cytidine1402-2'-O)-methyltransferase
VGDAASDAPAPGRLYLVATPLGNLEDMTYRAVRVLGEVAIVAAEDTRAAEVLFRHFGLRPPRVVSLFEGNEAERAAQLVQALERGASVALIAEAGTPAISDPGERLVRAAIDAGVRVEPVPGPSAVIAALIASGLPTARFAFHGFPPREPGARRALFGSLRTDPATAVFYEAPGRVGATLRDLADAFGGERPAVLARELTKIHEELVRDRLAALADLYAHAPPRGECTLVVGGARAEAGDAEVDIEAEMRALLAAGLGPRDAARRLVVVTGKPRRQLYQLALALAGERKPDGE